MTFNEIVTLEPQIGAVVNGLKPATSWREYGSAKADIYPLVGWGASVPELQNSNAYETVIRAILNRLKL